MSIKVDFSGQQAGQPANASEGAPAQEATTPQITLDDIRATMQSMFQEHDRQAQSARDKQEARIGKQLANVQAALKAAGLEIQPDQMRQVEQVVRQQQATADNVSDEPPAQGGKQERGQDGNAQVNPIDAYVNGLHEAYDFELNENDPEAAPVKQAKSEKEFKKLYKTAMDSKAQRLEQEGKRDAANRLPGAGGGGMGADSIDGIVNQLTELTKNPSPQNLAKIKELKGRLAAFNK